MSDELAPGVPHDSDGEIGHEHADVTGGWLRPAVFGAMDGLVSNVALIAGVAGGTAASAGTKPVILAGLAGLSAGAFSMAVGEYTSVASQAEAAQHEIHKERREIQRNSAGEQAELAAMYVAKGLTPELAAQVAEQIHEDPEQAVAVHAREEFGIDPDDLTSPMLAAVSSFIAFTIGALVPLAPYFFGVSSVWPAVLVTMAALFACGAVVTQMTSRAWWFGGARQMSLGAAAAGITYVVGSLVGTTGA
ncbi:VIT1/CCC1 transporter family protein [Nocardioides marmoribigeumensis]|jgi:VIT1/CCC1 family predicted Fe2+/Mn2+ transporter|uniref:VIT1/CCC1 family predicted Fe2+/Mn2+ transporter n=1 Tax=Nocardioides marmoribigeumensis TaxID=433649 RepID=A0ABU2BRJ4_9ACTN|nr:VIT1/CCC1 transporter family protein [Nocardioides marmoribigeumensis]MDR7361233.1 VIT1/CCC1 family predicted Fe2+/Mn2+ transporter [Nocardioides marmoribigeumensis]